MLLVSRQRDELWRLSSLRSLTQRLDSRRGAELIGSSLSAESRIRSTTPRSACGDMYLQPRKRQRVESQTESRDPPIGSSWAQTTPTTTTTTAASAVTSLTGMQLVAAASTRTPPVRTEPAASAPAGPYANRTTRLRPYPCRVCGVMLSSASNRVRHERTKHHQAPQVQAESKEAIVDAQIGNNTPVSPAYNRLVEAERDEGEADGEMAAMVGPHDSHAMALTSSHALLAVEEAAMMSHAELPARAMEVEPDDDDDMPPASPSRAVIAASASASASASSDLAHQPPLAPAPAPATAQILNEADLQRNCYRFLQWLTQGPLTQCEALVKTRRVNSMTQLQPIRLNLRFLFALLQQRGAVIGVDLEVFTRLPICQALYEALTGRQVGSGRIHALFLLIKKILVFLTSERSAKEQKYIQPSTLDSYFYVDGVCSENSQRRKQESRNRILLGVQASRRARQSVSNPRAVFQVPTVWSSTSASSEEHDSQHEEAPASAASAASERASSVESDAIDCNELSPEELKLVAQGCLRALKDATPEMEVATMESPRAKDNAFVNYLATATLCLAMAPRSQVLKELRIGQTFVKEEDGLYWVKMPAEYNKNARPTLFALPAELTAPFDLYLRSIRPRLVHGTAQHNYVFFKRNGAAPRSDFSELTAAATQQLLNRPVNAHAFRSALITTYYAAGATQCDMNTLANIMAHDPTTARNYYYRQEMAQAALNTGQRMADLLEISEQRAVEAEASATN